MFSTVYVPLDNSDHSNAAAAVAVSLAHAFGSRIVASHVYAARMHDYRFKQMEYTLPEEYQDEQELERQRKIHDTLITRGLRLISDSYLDVLQNRCLAENIPFEPRMFDGKNWQVLVEDINTSGYDLVIMGAQGFGATKEAQLGSVCERVVRRIRTDTIVVKDTHAWTERPEGSIAVCIDGSPQSFGGLRLALELGRALGRPVEAVAVYDPYLHYAMFNGIVGVLSQEASKVFRFKEQEQLHEEIIDTGLAKIYESHLQVARRVAEQEGVDLKVTLLDGKAWEKVAHWARQEQPWLLVMGRIGVHSDDEMDIGSNTEHLLRAAGCNVLLASGTYVPPVDVRAEEIIIWTPEANQKMERVPQFVRGIARTAIHRWAMERGTSIISTDIIDEACLDILPPSAAKAMGIVAKRVAVAHELAAPETSAGRLPPGAEGHSGKTYICGECGYAARDVLPVACPICRSGPERFAIIDRREIEAAAAHQGPIAEHETFDGQKVAWTEEARRLLFSMTDAYARRRAKARIEKQARTRRLPVVTIEFASPVVQEMIGDLARLHGPNPPAPFPLRWEGGAGAERLAQSPALVGEGGTEEVQAVHMSANERVEADGQAARSADSQDVDRSGADAQGTKAPEIDSRAIEGRAMEGRGTNGQREEAGVVALPWTIDALARLDRVPAGYMRDMTRDLVLQHAAGSGAAEVTLVVCEGGIAVAKREMVAMIAAHSARKAARAQANRHTADTTPAVGVNVAAGGASAAGAGERCPLPDLAAHPAGGQAQSGRTLAADSHAEAAGTQPHWPSAADALNEVKPAFIARLARYYAPGTAGRQIPPLLDFIWSPEAERLVAEVPVYCRELARWRVEWTAYSLHLGRLITPELWYRDHADWSELADHLSLARRRRLAWDPVARARLEHAPAFVRDQVALAVEINSDHLGYDAVTAHAFDAVIGRWQRESHATAG